MNTEQFLEHFQDAFDEEGRRLILEFFVAFSRIEFALKSENFVQGQDRISANWDAFVATLVFDPDANAELRDSVDYLLQHPPKVQAIRNSAIVWEDRNIDANSPMVNKLRLHITDIRNNLFHGGKFNGTFERENSRNYKLVKSALVVLNNWLTLNHNVHHHFSKHIN